MKILKSKFTLALCLFAVGAIASLAFTAQVDGELTQSNLVEARRHARDYNISPVSFRAMDDFFDSAPVSAKPGTPLPQALKPLDFTIDLGGQTFNLEQALRHTDTNAILVMHEGNIVYERYFNGANEESRFIGWSISKSIVSVLFGILLDESRINSIDDNIETYLPQLKGTAFEGVTLKQMLLQKSGTDYTEQVLVGKADLDTLKEDSLFTGSKRFTDISGLNLQRDSEPGSVFSYSTLNSTLLGLVLEAAGGTDLATLTREKLWHPAGMQQSAYWLLDGAPGEGLAFGGGGFNATVRDYARIGQMMLQKGFINGRQVVPANWVGESTRYATDKPVIPGAPRGYQYQWWTFLNTEIFEAVGIHGQFISIDPVTETVIVKTSYWPVPGGGPYPREHMELFAAIRKQITK